MNINHAKDVFVNDARVDLIKLGLKLRPSHHPINPRSCKKSDSAEDLIHNSFIGIDNQHQNVSVFTGFPKVCSVWQRYVEGCVEMQVAKAKSLGICAKCPKSCLEHHFDYLVSNAPLQVSYVASIILTLLLKNTP